MTKRELNKKLKSKTLEIRNGLYIRNGIVRVLRAKNKTNRYYMNEVVVDIEIFAEVENTDGIFNLLNNYGPKSIRKFLRREESNVTKTVRNWVKLWGFTDLITIGTIKLISRKSQLTNSYKICTRSSAG